MGWWGRRAVAAVVVWCVVGGSTSLAAEVSAIEVRAVPGGAAVLITAEASAQPSLHATRTADGDLRRIYVDYPRGTRIGRELRRVQAGAGPVQAIRVGSGDEGRIRIVVDTRDASRYQVRREPGGAALAILVAETGHGGPPAEPQVAERRRPRIVLDPGHGGSDPGATGMAVEKDVTLALAHQLAPLLTAELGADVQLTRDDDRSLSLAQRTLAANRSRADLFVSIHANASPHPDRRGVETYYLDNTDDRATLRVAAMENRSGRGRTPGETDLRYILTSLVQGEKQATSARLATCVQRSLVRRLKDEWADTVDLGVKPGPFYVLVGAYMPSILVEASFLSHPEEGARLADPAYQRAVAQGIVAGIARFVADVHAVDTL